MVDHYDVLQVSPHAEPDVIRAAFRALARRHHPDFGGDQRRMMQINEAWSVLGNRKRRAAYDATRPRGRSRLDHAPMRAAPPAYDASPVMAATRPSGPIAAAAQRRAASEGRSEAGGAPAGLGQGAVLDFGRYAGWSVAALAQHDPDYLLWLERTPIGRPLRSEIRERVGSGSAATITAPAPRASLLRRRR